MIPSETRNIYQKNPTNLEDLFHHYFDPHNISLKDAVEKMMEGSWSLNQIEYFTEIASEAWPVVFSKHLSQHGRNASTLLWHVIGTLTENEEGKYNDRIVAIRTDLLQFIQEEYGPETRTKELLTLNLENYCITITQSL